MPSSNFSDLGAVLDLPCEAAVIWIDWYSYHVARLRGLLAAPTLRGRVCGIELVGGIGVHAGLKFREDLPADLPVHTLLPQSSWSEAGQFRLALQLWRQLTLRNPNAVLVPGYYNLPAIGAAIWAKLHQRVSVLMTESTADDHARVPWREFGKRLLLRALFDFAVTGGEAHRRYLQHLGFPEDRIARFYDVVDNDGLADRVRALRGLRPTEFNLPPFYFLYVGRLAAEKNIRGLMEAWISYRESGGTWSLVLVGDGPEAQDLRDLARATPYSDDIHFAGHRGSGDLPLFYAFAGCFVLPSTREPWGLVVNEAMACNLPVLVSERCGCAEDLVRPGLNGFTFDPSEKGEILNCLHSISSSSPEQRQLLRSNSAEVIRVYSPAKLGLEIAHIVKLSSAAC